MGERHLCCSTPKSFGRRKVKTTAKASLLSSNRRQVEKRQVTETKDSKTHPAKVRRDAKIKELKTETIKKNENINEANILDILNGKGDKLLQSENGRVILYGVNKKKIKAHTLNQIKLVESFDKNDMVFAVGPAGTGKTYTGIAIAVKALKSKTVKRIILTRPAVEAGENLGFLPGDLKDKLDPYMQPLYDALKEMIPTEKLEDYIKRGIIEIAPLAYMRGRTLDNAFVILDEGQNTTHNQMKMFLTRMGKNAKFMITGDPGQIDLPRSSISGLKEANLILQNIEGIDIVYLDDKDVIRHKVVKKIIDAYKKTEHAN